MFTLQSVAASSVVRLSMAQCPPSGKNGSKELKSGRKATLLLVLEMHWAKNLQLRQTRGAARGKLMVATASSMEFRLAATSGRKLHARIHDDAAAASRHSMKVAFSDSLWHSSCVKMNWRLQLCFFNSYSNSIWRSGCVILNPSMQLPWRLKNCLLPLPIWFLSTWVYFNLSGKITAMLISR